MSIFDEDKIYCHNHVLDPLHFPYATKISYRPAGQEIGSQVQRRSIMDACDIRHALIVRPNSGYGKDNRYLLDTVDRSEGRFNDMAVVPNETSIERFSEFKEQNVAGIAFNPSLPGLNHYTDAAQLMHRRAELELLVRVQVHQDQMVQSPPCLLKAVRTI